jgi:hypothetical protein
MIFLPTPNPADLLKKIKNAIDRGSIKTWKYDGDGDFTHTADQWNQKAWLRPILAPSSLNLHIVRPQGVQISKLVYAIYHGRFIEMVLHHFDSDISGNASASAKAMSPDRVG